MKKPSPTHKLTSVDRAFALFLRTHDPVEAPTDGELARCEARLMAKVDALSQEPTGPDASLPLWKTGLTWMSKGAVAGILCVALGFMVGRNITDPVVQTADASALFAADGATPWQFLINAPSWSGDTDDATE